MTNWGILGLGFIANKFVDAIKEVPENKIIGVASLTKKKSDEIIKKYGINKEHYYNNYEDLINSSEIDAIYIATLNNTHADLIEKCAIAQKKILCEKPMCLNLDEAKKIYAYLQNSRIFFVEGFAYRSHEQTTELCNIINSGEIGKIIGIESSFGFKSKTNPNSRLFNKNFGGGAIFDVGCYTTSFSLLIARATLGEKYRNYKLQNILGSLGETGVDVHAEADLIFNEELKIKIKTSLKENLANEFVLYGLKVKIIIPSPWLPSLKSYIEIHNNNSYYKKFIYSKFSIYAQQINKFNQILLNKNPVIFDTLMNQEESLINFEIINEWKNALENQTS